MLAAFATVAGFAKSAAAAQTLIVDETFQHQASEASHHTTKPVATMPANLAAPDDYRNGSVHLRVELKTTASNKPIRWLLTLAQGTAYVCVGPQKAMPGPGVYEWDVPLSALECIHAPAYDKAKPPTALSFIIRDGKGVKVDPGAAFDGAPNLGLYFPLSARVTITLVSNGAKYVPDANMPATPEDGEADPESGEGSTPESESSADDVNAAGDPPAAAAPPKEPYRRPDIIQGCASSPRPSDPASFLALPALGLVGLMIGRRRDRRSRVACDVRHRDVVGGQDPRR